MAKKKSNSSVETLLASLVKQNRALFKRIEKLEKEIAKLKKLTKKKKLNKSKITNDVQLESRFTDTAKCTDSHESRSKSQEIRSIEIFSDPTKKLSEQMNEEVLLNMMTTGRRKGKKKKM